MVNPSHKNINKQSEDSYEQGTGSTVSAASSSAPTASHGGGGILLNQPNTGASPKTSGNLPPLKKKSVTVKENVPPPVPPRGSSPRANMTKSGKTVRVATDRTQHLSTGE